jgi:heme/copper-type cytochrome/quinol oxidase subunit 2
LTVHSLSEEDVDRIARRVALKLILYVALIVFILWIVRYVVFEVIALLSSGTNGNPFVALLPLAMSVLAVPAIILILVWGRSKRAR